MPETMFEATRDETQRLALVADDLTGALDTAAQFASADHPLSVTWHRVEASCATGSVVVDTACREATAATAGLRFADHVPLLEAAPGRLSMLKLDSLLRGHPAAELAACHRRWPLRPIVVAPAFPGNGRVTRGGRQYLREGTSWSAVGMDLPAGLTSAGAAIRLCRPGDPIHGGLNLFDADTDADLAAIVAAGRAASRSPLWSGSAGLAAALAGAFGFAGRRAAVAIEPPLLALVGSDHPVSGRQLAAVASSLVTLGGASDAAAGLVRDRLAGDGAAIVAFAPTSTDRARARCEIEIAARALLAALARPGTLFVSGGETLRSVCDALGATSLAVDGEIATGVPTSTLRGGRWNGLRLVSKSGAFGADGFLADLVAATRSMPRRKDT